MAYRFRLSLALSVGLLSLLTPFALAADFTTARVAVYFSPSGGATDAVVREINAAKQQILVQAYSFTSVPIAKALVDAHKRGVTVLAVLDKSQQTEKYSAATFLMNAGIQTLIDDQHAIAHNKEPSQNNFSKFTLLLYDIYAREPHGLHGNTWLSW
jgi:phosphatidylserine/phosphatidylglycerophosphate/cardiolipin synthase-like enzyme